MAITPNDEMVPFMTYEENRNIPPYIVQNDNACFICKKAVSCGVFTVVQVFLLILNIAFLLFNSINRPCLSSPIVGDNESRAAYSPAETALRQIIKEHHSSSVPSPFMGKPRPQLDQAWSNLLRYSNIRLSEDELRQMNKTSIALRDGSGYIGYLESIHMLHCVKRIYQSRYLDHYPELQNTDAFTPEHWDHCLEVLREGIMCNADVTVNTYFWQTPFEIKGKRDGPRKCMDWSLIEAWADERSLNASSRAQFLDSLVPSNESDDQILSRNSA
ncbi:hypothetical protein F4679DRAFT_566706 [Xylaria curta]|nr:hypothetical protein F4679DRAFT_566706 [Xylaria curta]